MRYGIKVNRLKRNIKIYLYRIKGGRKLGVQK